MLEGEYLPPLFLERAKGGTKEEERER